MRSMPPKPSLFMDPKMDASRQDYGHHHPVAPDMPNTFIPPQAERIQQRPRMPRIEDLPMPAQRQILQKRGELGDEHPDRQRKGLFQRIASGLTGRDSEPMHEPAPAIRPLPQGQGYAQGPSHGHAHGQGLPPRPASRPLEKRESMPNAGPRAPQGLDPHGRPAPVHNSGEDDQLEIPAFLRRQAN